MIDFGHFPLQFITNADTEEDILKQTKATLDGGCRWVQLRMKDRPETEVEATARKVKILTDSYGATLIIDDHVNVALSVNASGVHLGKNDMAPADAREILGNKKIIGGTCNTYEDVLRIKDDVDYIGCGPFRFTTTKKNLAPVLGIEGYQELIWQMRSNGINTPVVAIGGITKKDIVDVLGAGPDGIAMSGEIIRADDMVLTTEEIVTLIESARK